MITLKDLLNSGGGATLGPTLATNFFESRTWTAPQNGIVIVRGMGAGGGGARHGTSATGGYSGSWGCKIVRVKKGDTISVAIGAGGGGAAYDGDGVAGGDTIITINGVHYIAYGGPGGVSGAAGPLPNGPSPSANWDFGASSVAPRWASSSRTGGAGVDILAQGNNATSGGGTGGNGGGAMPGGRSALGSLPASGNPGIDFDASQGEWGISFYGGSVGSTSSSNGLAGGNGGAGGNAAASSTRGGNGGNGGGGGSGSSMPGGTGGIGGGGGGTSSSSAGSGGQGFAHLKFFADMGV